MNCYFCGELLSQLFAAFIALITFLVVPVMQILGATMKLISDKIISLKKV
ncbi:hypothetical protein HYS95_00965 [Candidatus Daviesbacteria bacterium]|nr:hypothetical protein [Candidatus Daviesbacteria bacterium]